ncbi:MAG: lipopolysaccharide kinase InaA family protein [Acidobacteriota bacterium]
MSLERFSFPGWTGELDPDLRPVDLEAEVRRLTDPGSSLRTLHWGRNYLYVTRMETVRGPVDVVVKQFRNQGAKARLNRRLKGSKAERSWKVALVLQDAGLLTPAPVMRIESVEPEGPSFYICRQLEGATEARYLLREANAGNADEGLLQDLGRLARRLHDAGIWFRDFTSGNVLVHPDGLYLVDLNRARVGKPPSLSERMRDLSRMPVLRPEHQEIFLSGYGPERSRVLYLYYHHAFLLKNRTKQRVRGGGRRLKELLVPRKAHVHIPEAPAGASIRDRAVWDHLSDQPHQHAGRLDKLRVRLGDAGAHAKEAAVVAAALPRIRARYKELKRELHRKPIDFRGCGVAVRPWPDDPEALLGLIEELGAKHVLVRLHPWEDDHAAEEELARELHGRGLELTFALPQNRDLVRDPRRWRRSIEEIGARFIPYGARFQVGQAINRSKWGVWSLGEYLRLMEEASDVLRRHPGVEILGPSVIDFEYHVTAAALNLKRPGLHFDAVSALLYVDRRGAPENRQAGLDTEGKVLLLKAIADTSRNSTGRCWITEVNWPLREGPHSPAGRAVSVGEEEAADYLVRYYLLALGTGAVERVFWWQMIAKGYGLVDPVAPGELRRRPAFHAFRALIQELEGSRLETVLPVPEPARLWRFRRPDGAGVLVGWSTAGAVRVRLPDGAEVEVASMPQYFRPA